MKNSDMEHSEIFDLDPNLLDEEWVRQPVLYHHYAIELANARAELERLRAARDVTTAELDKNIRAVPEEFGLLKITEGGVQQTVILQPRYQEADQAVRDAKHAVDISQVAVDTLDHRKKALEKLVDLRLADYFSTPRASGVSKERMDGVEKREVRKRGQVK